MMKKNPGAGHQGFDLLPAAYGKWKKTVPLAVAV